MEEEIVKGIKSRARVLHSQFPFLEYDDLVQDGYVLVLEIRNKHPDAHIMYIMKAINNYYSNVQDDARYTRSRTTQLSCIPDDLLGGKETNVDDRIDMERTNAKLVEKSDTGSAEEYALYSSIKNFGLDETEALELFGIDYRKIVKKGKGK